MKSVIDGSLCGTIELIENKTIKYFLVIEKQKEFYLTTKEEPEIKNGNKFTNIYYKKAN